MLKAFFLKREEILSLRNRKNGELTSEEMKKEPKQALFKLINESRTQR
ncbi:hypothetical protein BSM4216_2906 [Bacillus smithii]|nr:hypothetical protein BSM4216_2906 [Bacillus smithii]